MARCVALDITRLFIGAMTATPRGIDRVDLAYAKHFLREWQGDCVGVLPTPWGIRWFNRERSLKVVNFIENYWGENEDPCTDRIYRWVKSRLNGDRSSLPVKKERSVAAGTLSGFVSYTWQYGVAFGRPIRSLPTDAVYLNTGQTTLAVARLLKWLASRADVTAIFMLHDAIPIEFPEYCSPRLSRSHAQMLANTARYAKRLIVTTEAAGASIKRELARLHRNDIAMLALPLPPPAPFLQPVAADPELRNSTYFVVSGAIEPRKNHLLLLNVWRQLVTDHGSSAPKLVLVGSRWRASDDVINMLDRCRIIRDHVIEISGLSTPALRQLLAGARALLMPSFAEGFGIPIVEALAVGTPVIASDLPEHRQTAGGSAQYLSALDGTGWLRAISEQASETTAAGSAARALVPLYQAPTWANYFQQVELFVR